MHPYEVLRRPLITEKTTWQTGYESPQYAFEVDGRANKQQIKEAVEIAFDVKVTRVNIAVMPKKMKRNQRTRRSMIRQSEWKKAVVQVRPTERIGIFEGVA